MDFLILSPIKLNLQATMIFVARIVKFKHLPKSETFPPGHFYI